MIKIKNQKLKTKKNNNRKKSNRKKSNRKKSNRKKSNRQKSNRTKSNNSNSKKHVKEVINKYYKKNSVSKKFLLKLKKWSKEEQFYSYNQGKGYGSSSIQKEVGICSTFMIHKPSIFIDIGAAKGNYTSEVLKYFPDIEAFLFEPSKAHKELYKNTFKNMNNVHINHLALSNVNGKQKLYYDQPGSSLASLTKRRLDHFRTYMNYSEEIETIRFDDFWKNTDIYKKNPDTIIDYIKIDVEGHELWVIEGFGDLLNKIGIIQFEFGGTNIDTRTFFQDFWYIFKDNNFSIYRIAPNGSIPITKYVESDEYFSTTNYIAVNNKINKLNK